MIDESRRSALAHLGAGLCLLPARKLAALVPLMGRGGLLEHQTFPLSRLPVASAYTSGLRAREAFGLRMLTRS